MNTNTTVAYLRVSTETQLDGYGLDIQDTAVNNLAELEGLTIDQTFTDGALSGTYDASDRPGLDELIVWCQDHPGTTVIIPKLDRLARALVVQETVLGVLWNAGATVRSCDSGEDHYCRTGDDPDDPTRTLIRQVLGAVAQFERGQIRLRLRAGRRRRIAHTGWAGGIEPYGHSDPDEQRVIADVARWRSLGKTWSACCADLNHAGRTKRGGGLWNKSELSRMMRRFDARPTAA